MHSMYSTIDGLFLSLHQIVTLNKSKHAHTDVYMCSFRPISFVAMLPEICKVLQSCLHMCTHKHEDAWRHVKHANGCSICMWLFLASFPGAGPPVSAGEQGEGARVHFRAIACLCTRTHSSEVDHERAICTLLLKRRVDLIVFCQTCAQIWEKESMYKSS